MKQESRRARSAPRAGAGSSAAARARPVILSGAREARAVEGRASGGSGGVPPIPKVTPAGVGAILFSPAQIAAAVERLAEAIGRGSPGEPVALVGVLKGALFLTVDLARALRPARDVRIDFLRVSSYGSATHSSGDVSLLKDTSESVEGKHVVIVEDIVDNGHTLAYLERLLTSRRPASLRSCALLDKPYRRSADVRLDYVGLTAPDAFIVGYGLDYQEKYRNLPYLATLEPREDKRT